MSAEQYVARGAALLDEVAPGWETVINVRTLNIASASRCALAQTAANHGEFQQKINRYYRRLGLSPLGGPDLNGFGMADVYLRHTVFGYEGWNYGFTCAPDTSYAELEWCWRELILARRKAQQKAKPKRTDYVLTA